MFFRKWKISFIEKLWRFIKKNRNFNRNKWSYKFKFRLKSLGILIAKKRNLRIKLINRNFEKRLSLVKMWKVKNK